MAKEPFKLGYGMYTCILQWMSDRQIYQTWLFLIDHWSLYASFFFQTIRDWNDLSDSLFSTEMSDDCVSKFALLMRSRD